MKLTLKEAVFGCKRDINVVYPIACETCSGSGAAKGTGPTTCGSCRGRGTVAHGAGGFLISTTCPECGGRGSIVRTPCAECKGRGEARQEKKVKVSMPPGIDHGQAIRVTGLGEPGTNGGPPGHLLVGVEVEPHDTYHRDGFDLAVELRISFVQAALGGNVQVPTLDDKALKLTIPPGTQPGHVFTFEGEGVPHVERKGRGRLLVVAKVDVPKHLNDKQKKALRELEKVLGEAK